MSDKDFLTIDELARAAGTTVRNVRVYQDRGLLAPPERRGRLGLYGPDHLRRLRLVLRMLGRGYPLAAIRELVEAWEEQRDIASVLGLEEAITAPYQSEGPSRRPTPPWPRPWRSTPTRCSPRRRPAWRRNRPGAGSRPPPKPASRSSARRRRSAGARPRGARGGRWSVVAVTGGHHDEGAPG